MLGSFSICMKPSQPNATDSNPGYRIAIFLGGFSGCLKAGCKMLLVAIFGAESKPDVFRTIVEQFKLTIGIGDSFRTNRCNKRNKKEPCQSIPIRVFETPPNFCKHEWTFMVGSDLQAFCFCPNEERPSGKIPESL